MNNDDNDSVENELLNELRIRSGIQLKRLASALRGGDSINDRLISACVDLVASQSSPGLRTVMYQIIYTSQLSAHHSVLLEYLQSEVDMIASRILQSLVLGKYSGDKTQIAKIFLDRASLLGAESLRFLIKTAGRHKEIGEALRAKIDEELLDLVELHALAKNWPGDYDRIFDGNPISNQRLKAWQCSSLMAFQVPHADWYLYRANVVPYFAIILFLKNITGIDFRNAIEEAALTTGISLVTSGLKLPSFDSLSTPSCSLIGYVEDDALNCRLALLVSIERIQRDLTSKSMVRGSGRRHRETRLADSYLETTVLAIRAPIPRGSNLLPKNILPENDPSRFIRADPD